MKLLLERSVFKPDATFDKLYLKGKFFAYTCEDMVRNLHGDCRKKVKNQTAIDPGTYEVILSFSNRFQKYLPLLLNVSCFEGVSIHGGNTASDTEGCLLVGAESDMNTRIWNCASKVASLVALLKSIERKEKMFVEIKTAAIV
ncbi:MAG: hypothetical protein JST81_15040 [Bacteroidetes bacterium]|nr:hypothetical protein [Bacteroidota bacterium]